MDLHRFFRFFDFSSLQSIYFQKNIVPLFVLFFSFNPHSLKLWSIPCVDWGVGFGVVAGGLVVGDHGVVDGGEGGSFGGAGCVGPLRSCFVPLPHFIQQVHGLNTCATMVNFSPVKMPIDM